MSYNNNQFTPAYSARARGADTLAGDYDGKELRNVEIRPGSLDSLAIPSLIGNQRVTRYERCDGPDGTPTYRLKPHSGQETYTPRTAPPGYGEDTA